MNQLAIHGAAAWGVLIFAAACARPSAPERDEPPRPPPATFGETCGGCVGTTCSTELAGCEAREGCARHWSCLLACPADEAGEPTAACASACSPPEAPAALGALAELDACRQGAQVRFECAGCPGAYPPPTSACLHHSSCDASGLAPDAEACAVCTASSCCGARDAFLDNPEAGALRDCYVACLDETPEDAGCFSRCDDFHPNGLGDLAALSQCSAVYCSEPCAGRAAEPCFTCSARACEVAFAEANCTASGRRLQSCFVGCAGDLSCEGSCLDQHPEAATHLESLSSCITVECAEVCGA